MPAVLDAIGVNTARRTTEAEFKVGTVVIGDDANAWTYGKASETVATGTCTLNGSTFAITDAAGNHTADTAFAANEYGWVRRTTTPF
jgi:hypothetical protein